VVVLIGIAFLAGVITAVSPCVLPVLPIVLAGGASGGRRRPYAIVAGLVTMFVFSILFASYFLQKLGLPQDLLRDISIALLFAVAATLVFPKLALLVERALAPLSRRRSNHIDSGFLLGCALGFAFVPCGGPILAYVSAQSATLDFGFKSFALAVSYALGASVVLLAIAIGGQRVARPLRSRALWLRIVLGVDRRRRSAGSRLQRRHEAAELACRTGRTSSRSTPRTRPSRATGSTAIRSSSRCRPLSPSCRLRPRPVAGRRRNLDQLEASDDGQAPGKGGPHRLLDLLLHQLPAHPSAARGLGQAVPQGRARNRRSAYARVRVRARDVQCLGCGQAPGRPLSSRPGQQVRDLERVYATSTGRPST
jgi:cytochrome c biogenesis protein CcdA